METVVVRLQTCCCCCCFCCCCCYICCMVSSASVDVVTFCGVTQTGASTRNTKARERTLCRAVHAKVPRQADYNRKNISNILKKVSLRQSGTINHSRVSCVITERWYNAVLKYNLPLHIPLSKKVISAARLPSKKEHYYFHHV